MNDSGIKYTVINFSDEVSATYAWEMILGGGKFCKLVRTDDNRWQVHVPESMAEEDLRWRPPMVKQEEE